LQRWSSAVRLRLRSPLSATFTTVAFDHSSGNQHLIAELEGSCPRAPDTTSHSWARFSYASAAPAVEVLIFGSVTWAATERISSARVRQCFGSLTSLRSCLFIRTSSQLSATPSYLAPPGACAHYHFSRCGSVLTKMYCSCRPTATARLHQDALVATKSVPRISEVRDMGRRSRPHRKLNPERSFLQCLSESTPLLESRGHSDAATQRRCE
jgi:hypothetical protein